MELALGELLPNLVDGLLGGKLLLLLLLLVIVVCGGGLGPGSTRVVGLF